MGLGKTLSMISLVASDLLVDRNDPNSITGANAEESSGRTLIVVPPPRELNTTNLSGLNSLQRLNIPHKTVLDSWEEQLKQ